MFVIILTTSVLQVEYMLRYRRSHTNS